MIMISLIIKNLWHRRVANIWLFIELVVVTVVTWVKIIRQTRSKMTYGTWDAEAQICKVCAGS